MKRIIKLDQLKVNSFVTTVNEDSTKLLKGGDGTAASNDGQAACLVGDTVCPDDASAFPFGICF